MHKILNYMEKGVLGTAKGILIGTALWGVHFYMIDTLQSSLDVVNGKSQEEIYLKVGGIKGKEIYITRPYDLHYTSTITPYLIGGSALIGFIFNNISNKKSKLEQNVI